MVLRWGFCPTFWDKSGLKTLGQAPAYNEVVFKIPNQRRFLEFCVQTVSETQLEEV